MRRVLLGGKSLLILGLQASLAASPGLDLQNVDTQAEMIRERINAWQPHVLILEFQLFRSGLALSLLHDFPQMKLIGLDIEDNSFIVFSGLALEEPTEQKLLQVLEMI